MMREIQKLKDTDSTHSRDAKCKSKLLDVETVVGLLYETSLSRIKKKIINKLKQLKIHKFVHNVVKMDGSALSHRDIAPRPLFVKVDEEQKQQPVYMCSCHGSIMDDTFLVPGGKTIVFLTKSGSSEYESDHPDRVLNDPETYDKFIKYIREHNQQAIQKLLKSTNIFLYNERTLIHNHRLSFGPINIKDFHSRYGVERVTDFIVGDNIFENNVSWDTSIERYFKESIPLFKNKINELVQNNVVLYTSIIDGYELSEGDKIVLTGQTNSIDNGIYKIKSIIPSEQARWETHDDTPIAGHLLYSVLERQNVSYDYISIEKGLANKDTTWHRTITKNVEKWVQGPCRSPSDRITVAATDNIDSKNLKIDHYKPYTFEFTLKDLLTNILKSVGGIFVCSMCRGYNTLEQRRFELFDSDGTRLFRTKELKKNILVTNPPSRYLEKHILVTNPPSHYNDDGILVIHNKRQYDSKANEPIIEYTNDDYRECKFLLESEVNRYLNNSQRTDCFFTMNSMIVANVYFEKKYTIRDLYTDLSLDVTDLTFSILEGEGYLSILIVTDDKRNCTFKFSFPSKEVNSLTIEIEKLIYVMKKYFREGTHINSYSYNITADACRDSLDNLKQLINERYERFNQKGGHFLSDMYSDLDKLSKIFDSIYDNLGSKRSDPNDLFFTGNKIKQAIVKLKTETGKRKGIQTTHEWQEAVNTIVTKLREQSVYRKWFSFMSKNEIIKWYRVPNMRLFDFKKRNRTVYIDSPDEIQKIYGLRFRQKIGPPYLTGYSLPASFDHKSVNSNLIIDVEEQYYEVDSIKQSSSNQIDWEEIQFTDSFETALSENFTKISDVFDIPYIYMYSRIGIPNLLPPPSRIIFETSVQLPSKLPVIKRSVSVPNAVRKDKGSTRKRIYKRTSVRTTRRKPSNKLTSLSGGASQKRKHKLLRSTVRNRYRTKSFGSRKTPEQTMLAHKTLRHRPLRRSGKG